MTYENALVTGASRGIGAAIVRGLRGRGIAVHAVARPSTELAALATETGATAHAIDVRDTPALTTLIHDLRPDIVVNNAGVLPQLARFSELTPDTIDQSIDVNLRAALHITHAALGSMRERNRGHIFLVGSIAGRLPSPNIAVYSATKAGLHMFADGLRLDLLGTGIRVTTVMPGRVATSLYDGALGGHDQAQAQLYRGTEAVRPEDVAWAIGAALDMPANVDTSVIELMPTRQAYGGNQIAPRRDG
jgi:NADP-dependent 3-hydroxy acid dehydrogenase YdfG